VLLLDAGDDVRRLAVVGQEKDRWWLARLAEPFVGVRFFLPNEREEAWRWVAEGAQHDADEEWTRRLAYARWEAAGRPAGDGRVFWQEAEAELFHAG
jgi:hypothetical protein